MMMTADLDAVYVPSADVVAREIEGELILVPLAAGMGDLEEELFTLNPTGREIWRNLDGRRTLRQVAGDLRGAFEAPADVIERDVAGLVSELLGRKLVVAK